MAVEPADVRPRNADYGSADSHPGGFFRLGDCGAQRLDSRLNIDHDASA